MWKLDSTYVSVDCGFRTDDLKNHEQNNQKSLQQLALWTLYHLSWALQTVWVLLAWVNIPWTSVVKLFYLVSLYLCYNLWIADHQERNMPVHTDRALLAPSLPCFTREKKCCKIHLDNTWYLVLTLHIMVHIGSKILGLSSKFFCCGPMPLIKEHCATDWIKLSSGLYILCKDWWCSCVYRHSFMVLDQISLLDKQVWAWFNI